MKQTALLLPFIVCLSGCGYTLSTEFTPTGPLSSGRNTIRSSAQTWQEISVHYKSSPLGFTLRENELKIEDGYKHVILGELKVFARGDNIPKRTQAEVLSSLQQKAFEVGANAVIYVYSNISQAGSTLSELPPSGDASGGWAVIIKHQKASTTEAMSLPAR